MEIRDNTSSTTLRMIDSFNGCMILPKDILCRIIRGVIFYVEQVRPLTFLQRDIFLAYSHGVDDADDDRVDGQVFRFRCHAGA